MNILFLTNKSPYNKGAFGGAESSIRLLAEHLVARGHTVFYVTMGRSALTFPHLQKTSVEGVNLYIFRPAFWYRRSTRVRRFNKKINDKIFERQLRKIIESEHVQIVYCFYELGYLHPLLRISKEKPTVKVVMRMAGMRWYEKCFRNCRLISNYTKAFNGVDAVNFISQGLQSMVAKKFVELKMQVHFSYSFVADIGSSVKPGRTEPYEKLAERPFTIIMATRFSNYQKRQDILVRAISLVNRSYDLQVLLIGEGNERPKIERLVSDLGVQNRIEFVDFMVQEELWRTFQTAHLLCHTTDHEGLGKVIIESMAVGLPVLVSNVAPLNNYIEDGLNGFLVDNNPSDWARRIENLITDKTTRKTVSAASMDWINKNYDPARKVKEYEKHFEKILEM